MRAVTATSLLLITLGGCLWFAPDACAMSPITAPHIDLQHDPFAGTLTVTGFGDPVSFKGECWRADWSQVVLLDDDRGQAPCALDGPAGTVVPGETISATPRPLRVGDTLTALDTDCRIVLAHDLSNEIIGDWMQGAPA